MKDFDLKSGTPITKEIDEGQDNILQFTFTDGSVLRLRYDWIYEWEIQPPIG